MRSVGILVAVGCAMVFAGAAAAKCTLPAIVANDAVEAAKYLHRYEDAIVDGVVRVLPRGDNSLFQRIEIDQYLKGTGPQAIDIWPGPAKPAQHVILNTDDWGRIDAADGARVVTALKKTPYGWTVGECAYKALAVPGVEQALREGRFVTPVDPAKPKSKD